MQTKTALSLIPILLIFAYIIALSGYIHAYVLSIPITSIFILYLIYVAITNLIYSWLPKAAKSSYDVRPLLRKIILSAGFIFFLLTNWLANHFYLSSSDSHMIFLVALLTFLLTIYALWSIFIFELKRIFIITITVTVAILLFFVSQILTNDNTTQQSDTKLLTSLPYLAYVPKDYNEDKNGVTLHNETQCADGINIYNSYGLAGAYLLDMSGTILHRWLPKKSHWHWHYVEMYDQNDLLVIVKDVMLMRLDWNSNIIWTNKMRYHHDLAIDETNNIFVLARRDKLFFKLGIPLPILNDYIAIIKPDGEVKKEISFYKILAKKIPFQKILEIYHWSLIPRNIKEVIKLKVFANGSSADIFHVNTIELINKNINSVFRKGNLLFCSNKLNLIGIIDLSTESLTWSWGEDYLDRPHHPTLLRNGNLLIFDNGTYKRKYTRIIELDPLTKTIVWKYEASPPNSFFSSWGGANQRLSNGNTLITDSANGRVFEITPDGKIVWEFYNPNISKNGKRATIYRMMRIIDPSIYAVLKDL